MSVWGTPGAKRHWMLTLLTGIGLALAALPAAWPYFGAGLPRTNDALPHLYRTLALDRLVRAGLLWPRWSPDLVHGYGYPVFNFFPPLSHYLVELYHLTGLPLTTAYRATVLSHFVLAAWCAYLLARDLFGPPGGWVAALAYIYSPYLLYDAHVRGSLPETQALALLPLLLLTLRRATLHGGRWLAASALVFAAAFLSHVGIIFQSLIPIGIFLTWLGWHEGWRHLWKPLAGLALGVLVTAFFWLPALAEAQCVRSDASISQGYSYLDNFLTLHDLLAWPRLPADPALVNPPVVRSLPQVALVLAAIALPWRWRWLSHATRRQVGLWLGLLLVCTTLVMPLSRPVWDTLPLLNLTFFPWRFLGPASLAGALLVAASFADTTPSLHLGSVSGKSRLANPPSGTRARSLRQPAMRAHTLTYLAIATLLLLTGGVPWLYPPREPVPEAPTIAHLVAFEQPPLFIGTTTLGEFLPRWVETLPDTTDLRHRLASGESPDRLVAPEGMTARQLAGSPLDATYLIHADKLATLTYRQFYFPGWRATLDGEPLPCRPGYPDGLLLLDVPAGEHVLHLAFGPTPPRVLGWALSGLGALALVAVLVWAAPARQPPPRPSPMGGGRPPPPPVYGAAAPTPPVHGAAPSRAAAKALPMHWLLLLTSLTLVVKMFFDVVDTPLHRPTLGTEGLRGVQHAQAVDLAGELRLLGYEQSAERIPADGEITLILYWRPLRPIGVVYDVAVHLVDLVEKSGLVWSAGDATRPSDWRFAPGTDFWPLDGYVMDPSVLRLLDGTPPGEYTFHIGLVRHDTGQTIAEYQVGHLVVTRPARGDRPLEEGMKPAPETYAWGGLRLLGSRTDRCEAAPGDPARVTLLWQVTDPNAVANESSSSSQEGAGGIELPSSQEGPGGVELPSSQGGAGGVGQLALRLVTADGEEILVTTAPVARHYPPARWQPGDRLRTEILLRLPAHTPVGEHSWQIQLDQAAPRPIGSLYVHALERCWTAPPLDVEADTPLGDVATLLGANIQAPSPHLQPPATITVTLAWRAETETATSYRVFLHLVDPDGKLVAQSDGEPANWTRPTTGWLPGEVILDERVLDIPADTRPGEHTLLCGLYDLATGERLTTTNSSDALHLTTLLIGTHSYLPHSFPLWYNRFGQDSTEEATDDQSDNR